MVGVGRGPAQEWHQECRASGGRRGGGGLGRAEAAPVAGFVGMGGDVAGDVGGGTAKVILTTVDGGTVVPAGGSCPGDQAVAGWGVEDQEELRECSSCPLRVQALQVRHDDAIREGHGDAAALRGLRRGRGALLDHGSRLAPSDTTAGRPCRRLPARGRAAVGAARGPARAA